MKVATVSIQVRPWDIYRLSSVHNDVISDNINYVISRNNIRLFGDIPLQLYTAVSCLTE